MGRRPVRCRVLAYLRLARTHTHPGIFPEPERGPGRAALAMGSSGSPRHRRGSDLARSRVDLRRRSSRPPCPGSAERGALPGGSRGHRRDSARRGWTLAGEPLSTPRRTAPRNDRRVVPFCALPTVTPRISWPVASRWWEVLSDAAPGQSSNTVRCSSSNQTGPPNSWESATWPGSPRTLAFGLDLYKRRLPGRWSSNWSHAICPPPSAAGPPSWKKRFIGSPPGQDGAELCHTKLDGRATFKKEQRKRCVPRIRRRQVCQGSWNSETFSYNVGERLGGNLLQSTLDSS